MAFIGVSPGAIPRTRIALKTADESVIGSTTLQDDNELFFTVQANAIYEFELIFECKEEDAGMEIDYTFSGPAGSIGKFWVHLSQATFTNTLTPIDLGTEYRQLVGTAANWYGAQGWIETGNIDGYLRFRWAQNVIDAGDNLIVYAGSWMTIAKKSE